MRKKIALFLVLAASLTLAFATPVSKEKAATVATNFWSSTVQSKAPANLTLRTENWFYAGIYLFENEGGGWVLVTNDDSLYPILGYSPDGYISKADLPLSFTQWLSGYEAEIEAVWRARQQGLNVLADNKAVAEWYRLEQGVKGGHKSQPVVGPLLTVHWDQEYPYNYLCPPATVSGCAATALAQYMKFWNYPAFGVGSNSYTAPRTGTVESADFAHTIYDWDNMPDSTNQYNTIEKINAVATLMYHCGVALEMDYGTAASGGSAAAGLAGIDNIPSQDNALKDYFHYSRDMRVYHKDLGYTNDQWRAILINELDLGHPILYAGAATQGGHGFICDGYDDQQFLHFNFGWSGTGDGYFRVDNINPGVGGVGGNVTYTFNMNNSCLVGAVPDYALRVSDTLLGFDGDGGSDSIIIGINETNNSELIVASTVQWMTIDNPSFGRAGWLHFQVNPLDEVGERVGYIIVTQGYDTAFVKISQVNYRPEDMCPLTVVMQNTNNHFEGWQNDAFLSFESTGGYIFGKAQLTEPKSDTLVILVPHDSICAVWHSGGGTDRYASYWVRNQHGQNLVSVVNAYRNGGTHAIPEPCDHVGIDNVDSYQQCDIYPNPAHNQLNVRAVNLQQVDIVDLSGRCVATSDKSSVDISDLPNGHYFVRIVTTTGTVVKRFVKK